MPFHGTGAAIGQYLQAHKIDHIFIKHPIRNGYATRVEIYINGESKSEIRGVRWLPFPISTIQDFFITTQVIHAQRKSIDLFIGIDPLNACIALLLKRIYKIQKVVFYTADWTQTRFSNGLLNLIYHTIDRFCIARADEVWNVSKRISNLRNAQGVDRTKNKFMPNTPYMSHSMIKPMNRIRKYDLVNSTSRLSSNMNYDILFSLIAKIRLKHKQARLILIGDIGEYGRKLQKRVKKLGLSKSVIFLGLLHHEAVMDRISKCGIGLALFKGENSWDTYCDSMKVREYLACGTPVVMTSVSPTSYDIQRWKAGSVVDDTTNLLVIIDNIYAHKGLYETMRKNAIYVGKKYDFAKMLQERLDCLLQKHI